jgi:EmrB/QacA subfamily drug resistance transporter
MPNDKATEEAASSPQGGEAVGVSDEWRPLPLRQVVLTLGGLMLALFVAALDQTVVGTAIPQIVADLGGFDHFTWITSGYIVASTSAVPIVGRLTDLYGRKNFYIVGIIVFLVGSVLAGASQSMNQLIAFRALQGVGGGTMMALAFVTIGDLFPPADRGKYQGFVAAVFGLASVVGPTLGGFITDTLSWHWIFFINLPIGIPVVVLFVFFFPSQRPSSTKQKLDVAGMFLLVLAIATLLLALSWGNVQYDWASPQIVGLLIVAAVSTALLIAVELRAPYPIMPLSIYRNRIVSISLLAAFATGFGMFGAIIFIPLFFQGVLGASATSSGSFLTPMMLGMVFGAILSGQILSRMGGHYRTQGLVGLAIAMVGMVMLSRMTEETTFGRAVVNLVVMGFGIGTTFPTFTIAVQNAVPHNLLGAATAATQFYRSIGGALGLAILGSLMAGRFASGLAESLSPAVKEALPAEMLAGLSNNPQALVNPDALTSLRATLDQAGPQGVELAEQLLLALRSSLALAIGDIFLVSLVAAAGAFAVTMFLKELPLRTR